MSIISLPSWLVSRGRFFTSKSIVLQYQYNAKAGKYEYNQPTKHMMIDYVLGVTFAVVLHWPILDDFTSFSRATRPSA